MMHAFLAGLDANSLDIESKIPAEGKMDILFGANGWKPNQLRHVYIKLADDANGKRLVVESKKFFEDPMKLIGLGAVVVSFFAGRYSARMF